MTDPIATPYFYDRLRARIEGLADEELTWEPAPGVSTVAWRLAHIADGLAAERNWRWLGPVGGPFAESSRREFVLHMVDELIHHGAEVALLRDLYAARP